MSAAKLRIARHFLRAKWAFTHLRGEQLEAYQAKRARAMVQYAHAHSPFYREHWRGHDLNDWQNLPTVDKSLMMANFNTFNTVGVRQEEALEIALRAEQHRDFAPTLRGYTVGLSSGTSGQRGLFVVSAEEQEAWAGTLLARVLPRLRRQGWRVALFLRSNSNLYEQVGSRLVTFRYFDLMLPLEAAIAQLAAYQPDILVAPPSHLARIASHIGCGSDCTPAPICPEKVISVAEVMGAGERERLQEELHGAIGEIYQATEGLIGVTCSHGSLHVQEDVLSVQLAGIDAAQPQYVTPILTDLWRGTQPILQYRLGDIWIMEDTMCPCGSGFRVIRHVLGRMEDILYFPDVDDPRCRHAVFPDQVHALVHELVMPEPTAVPSGASAPISLRHYQAIQERSGHLRLHLDVPPECFAAIAARLHASIPLKLNSRGCYCEKLQIVPEMNPSPPNIKRQWVRNLAGNSSLEIEEKTKC